MRDGLKAIVKRGQDWRTRKRAETILLWATGHSVNGLWCFGFLMALSERLTQPLLMILDHASDLRFTLTALN